MKAEKLFKSTLRQQTLNRAFAPVLEVFTFILCVTSEASDLK